MDHNNDYYGQYFGISLSYGRKSGFGEYGPIKVEKGARIFELTEEPFSINSWIINSDLSYDLQTQEHYPPTISFAQRTSCSGNDKFFL